MKLFNPQYNISRTFNTINDYLKAKNELIKINYLISFNNKNHEVYVDKIFNTTKKLICNANNYELVLQLSNI